MLKNNDQFEKGSETKVGVTRPHIANSFFFKTVQFLKYLISLWCVGFQWNVISPCRLTKTLFMDVSFLLIC